MNIQTRQTRSMIRFAAGAAWIAALSVEVATCQAQTVPATPVPAPSVASVNAPVATSWAVAAEYRLAADDVLNINVVNFPSLSLAQLTVPPDGKISVPLLAPLNVAGLTVAEVTDELASQWRKYVINPSVFVSLAVKRHDVVVVYGFVLRPGGLDFRSPMRTLEALAQSGGALPQADMGHVTVTRRDGSKETVDLSHPETRSGTDNDIVLSQGDAIYVPEKRTQFSVVGQVNRPGSYDYREDMTVLDALTAVGGVLAPADLTAATWVHYGAERPIDLDALLRKGDMAINVKLAPGDRLMIPESRKRVYIFGAVEHPGYYNMHIGDHILDALHSSGGPLPEANLKVVNVVHIDATKNTGVGEQINIDKILSEGDMKGNLALEPGDVVFIPNKRKKMQWSDVWTVLSGINLLNAGAHIANKGLGN